MRGARAVIVNTVSGATGGAVAIGTLPGGQLNIKAIVNPPIAALFLNWAEDKGVENRLCRHVSCRGELSETLLAIMGAVAASEEKRYRGAAPLPLYYQTSSNRSADEQTPVDDLR